MISTARLDRIGFKELALLKKVPDARLCPRGTLKMAMDNCGVSVYAWMDTKAVYFIDAGIGPTCLLPMQRTQRHSCTSTTYQVPPAIIDYNRKMGGVDVKDQIDASMHKDQGFRCSKYTTKLFEILFSRTCGNAYNVHRYLHQSNPVKTLTRVKFMESVMNYFPNHFLTKNNVTTRPKDSPNRQHTLIQKGDDGSKEKRLKRGYCAVMCCSTKGARRTTWWCSVCDVPLHPDCFVAFHADNNA